jgi:predicted MPP superfamily phosphohydrolase
VTRARRRAVRTLPALAGALTGTAAGLALGGRVRRPIGPLAVLASLGVDLRGGTRLDLGLLGTASLPTHRGPLRLYVRAGAIDADAATRLADADAVAAARRAAPAEARALLRALAVRGASGGVAGACTVTAALTRNAHETAAAGALAAVALAGAGALASRTRSPDAWQRAQPVGLLEHAPRVLGDVRQIPVNLDRYRAQLVELLGTAAAVREHLTAPPEPPAADAIRLVHVSDIHLSPLVAPLVELLVGRYDAAAVIDTGDLVDWGTPAEDAVATAIGRLPVPYVYVKGNHDSAGTAAAVRRQHNATVLDGTTVDIAGLRFAGMADPRFTADKTTGDDHGMPRVRAAAERFASALPDDVDIALVHSPAAARPLAGRVPLVLAGDIHHREVHDLGHGTTLLVQGSSGGAGLRGVQQQPTVPLTLSVLHLDRGSRRLQAVDEITLGGLGRTEVDIVRRRVEDLVGAGRGG